jgi:hypothetical protein
MPENASVLEVLKEPLARFGFLRPSLRLKWYRRYLDLQIPILNSIGVTVATPDYTVAIDNGYLVPGYAEGLTHGNARYGALVASHLRQIIQDERQ